MLVTVCCSQLISEAEQAENIQEVDCSVCASSLNTKGNTV